MIVTLTSFELQLAAQVGIRRHIEALTRRLPNAHGLVNGDQAWSQHISGAAGEVAVAKAWNIFWSGSVNTFKLPDLDSNIQVRTRSRPHYDLIVREGDKDEDIFVLVIDQTPNFDVVGYIYGRDAKQPQWSAEHGGRPPAYFVPREALSI